MLGKFSNIKREAHWGNSKLDFCIDNVYLEVKTPFTTLHMKYGSNIKCKSISPFSATERFAKHIKELADSLEKNERAILLTVYQYEVTQIKRHQKSTNFKEVSETMNTALAKGLETWNIDMKFTPKGIFLLTCDKTG